MESSSNWLADIKVVRRTWDSFLKVVLSVYSGSPAYEAGLRKGDIITEFNGKTVKDYTAFGDLVNDLKPNQKVSAKIYRGGRYYTTTITVGSNNAIG